MAPRAVKVAVAKNDGRPIVFQTLTRSYDMDGDAVYCSDCHMWVNGPEAWHVHLIIGKKHGKNLRC